MKKRVAAVFAAVIPLVAVGTSGVASAGWGLPAGCSGYVGLTFDDGPTATTPELLSILRTNGATATFFDIGANMQKHPTQVRNESRLGQVGNHSYDHPFLDQMSYDAIFNELLGANQIEQQETGTISHLFRPPYDRIDSDVTNAQYSLGLLTVLWNVDSRDYDGITTAAIEHNVWHARAGDVILFHDGNPRTLAALPAVLTHLRNEGLCTGTIVASAKPHFAWHTANYGDVVFYARVVAPGARAPSVASLHLTPQQMSTAIGPGAGSPNA